MPETTQALATEVKQIMASVFEIDVASLPEVISKETVEQWDSIGHLHLTLDLENHFGISFEMNDIPNLNTLEAICSAIEKARA